MGVDPGYRSNQAIRPGTPTASSSVRNTGANRSRGSRVMPIDLTGDSPSKYAPQKPAIGKAKRRAPDDFENSSGPAPKRPQKSGQSPSKGKAPEKQEEKRLKRWRDHAPNSYHTIRCRALTQRMIVIDRIRPESTSDHPIEVVTMAGTTGNVYEIIIDKVPSCTCPHAKKGNQCKHIIYVLTRVLRVEQHLEYQLAFVSSELRDIFRRAPPLPSEQASGGEKDGSRKPLEGECPICCEDFEPGNTKEEIVYCKASCGNNIHKQCFDRWAMTKGTGGVTCPFCRAPWAKETASSLRSLASTARVNDEGYFNVAKQLGLNSYRDYSSYNKWFLQSQGLGRYY